MRRKSLFLKGNLDLRDSLHSLKMDGKVQWNGINEVVRHRFPDTTVRLYHETWTRSDALLEADGEIPGDLLDRTLPLGAYPVASQFSQALFDSKADAIVLSILPDVATHLLRHKHDKYLLYPGDMGYWPKDEAEWLRANFETTSQLDPETSMRNFAMIVGCIRAHSDAPVLVYNLSSVVPGDTTHCHEGLDEILSTRIKRFNVALVELSRQTGISIVDVDAVIARHGADRLKIDPFHLNAEGCRLVTEEVVRILEDCGCL